MTGTGSPGHRGWAVLFDQDGRGEMVHAQDCVSTGVGPAAWQAGCSCGWLGAARGSPDVHGARDVARSARGGPADPWDEWRAHLGEALTDDPPDRLL